MIEQHVELVKRQIDWYRSQIDRFPPDSPNYRPGPVALYRRLLQEHESLLAFLNGQLNSSFKSEKPPYIQTAPSEADQPLTNSHADGKSGDYSDLPRELLAELSGRTNRGQSDPLIQVINDNGGTAALDDILIGLYRKTGEIIKRNLLSNRLYRLSKQGLIRIVPNRKGVYTTNVDA
jgi:hypothetical protein